MAVEPLLRTEVQQDRGTVAWSRLAILHLTEGKRILQM